MSKDHPSVAELAAELQKALDTALAQNERLADQIKDSEARAQDAELRTRETREKLKILESLKTKEYQTVVTELFEGPSRRAVRITLIVAVASIVIGLAQTIVSSIYASRANAAAVVAFSPSLRSQLQKDIEVSSSRTKQDFNAVVINLQRDVSDLRRDGTTDAKALDLQSGVPITEVVALKENKYFQIGVPFNATRLEVVLTYFAPAHAHIYVGHAGNTPPTDLSRAYVAVEQCINGHKGSPDRCVFESPRAGSWIVMVQGFGPDVSNKPSALSRSGKTRSDPSLLKPESKATSLKPRSAFQLAATVI